VERDTSNDITVIGHGSLMSGRGLAFSGTLQVKDAFIVALKNCTRGFAKLSRYGDRFATDIEAPQFPLEGRRMSAAMPTNGDVETLALTVELADFLRLVKREGYRPEVMQQLAVLAGKGNRPLADFLWHLHANVGHDPVKYRRQLFTLTGYTSPHYIPHPVRLTDGSCALIFLAPGVEGTGSDEVASVRQQTGIRAVMNISEAWQRKPNDDQLAYFLSCLLGGMHGVNVRDLLGAIDEVPALARLLRDRLTQELYGELERFLAVTNLPESVYRRAFGGDEERLLRSGLHTFLLSEGSKH
jgi:hypothetical protein